MTRQFSVETAQDIPSRVPGARPGLFLLLVAKVSLGKSARASHHRPNSRRFLHASRARAIAAIEAANLILLLGDGRPQLAIDTDVVLPFDAARVIVETLQPAY